MSKDKTEEVKEENIGYDDGPDADSDSALVDAFNQFEDSRKDKGNKEEEDGDLENLEMDSAIDMDLFKNLDLDGDKKEEKKEEESKDEEKKDDEDDDFDTSKMSEESKNHFKTLKESKEKWKQKAEELEAKIVDPKETKEYKDLESQLTELKRIVEDEHFEKDPSFVEKYKNPVLAATEEVVKWAGTTEDKEDLDSINDLLKTMSGYVGDKANESRFFNLADKVADLIPGKSATNRFISASQKWFDAKQVYNEAFEDKNKTKEQIREEKERRSSESKGKTLTFLKSVVSNWKDANKETLDFFDRYKDKVQVDPEQEISSGVKRVEDLIERMSSTGEVPGELMSILVNGGITGKVLDEKYNFAIKAVQSLNSRVEELQKDVELKKKQLAKFTNSPNGSSSSSGGTREIDPESDSALADMYNAMMRGE